MGCSIGTVMSRLFYARRKMAALTDLKREYMNNQDLKLQAFLDGELPDREAAKCATAGNSGMSRARC